MTYRDAMVCSVCARVNDSKYSSGAHVNYDFTKHLAGAQITARTSERDHGESLMKCVDCYDCELRF